jgi:hypothetical protein
MANAVPIVVATLIAATICVIALRIFGGARQRGKTRIAANVSGYGLQTSVKAEAEVPGPQAAVVAKGTAVGRDGELEGETIHVEDSTFGRDLKVRQAPKA